MRPPWDGRVPRARCGGQEAFVPVGRRLRYLLPRSDQERGQSGSYIEKAFHKSQTSRKPSTRARSKTPTSASTCNEQGPQHDTCRSAKQSTSPTQGPQARALVRARSDRGKEGGNYWVSKERRCRLEHIRPASPGESASSWEEHSEK